MDVLVEALADLPSYLFLPAVTGIAFVLAQLLFELFERVLIPLCKHLWKDLAQGVQDFLACYREVTWRRRMTRILNEAEQAIDAARRDHVLLARAAIAAVEQQKQILTADETAAVRSAVNAP